jgi:hypothetical protein
MKDIQQFLKLLSHHATRARLNGQPLTSAEDVRIWLYALSIHAAHSETMEQFFSTLPED